MLNLNCAICAEIFAASDNVNCTCCGHMFHIACLNEWFQRSKTCPQCRNVCTERHVIRVYFNLASSDESRIDVGSLQEQLDYAQLQLQIKESKANELTKNLDDTEKKYTKRIADLENSLQNQCGLLVSHVEEIRMLENQNKEMESLRQECRTLKDKIKTMDGINTVLKRFFNLASSDESRIDVASLQEQLDYVQLQLQIKESKANELTKKLDDTQKKYMKKIADLEKNLQNKNGLLLIHVEKYLQIRMLENQNKEMESLRQECRNRKEQIETMDGINSVLKSQLTVSENKYSEIYNVLEVVQYELREEIKNKRLLEEFLSELQREKYQILEKIKMLELQNEAMKSSQEECRNLKEQIKKMNGISTILASTMSDAEKLVKNERDPNVLSIWISTLKRELSGCESQKTKIHNNLKVVQNDLRKQIEHKKSQDERIAQLEKENVQLLEQIKNLEAIRNNNNNNTTITSNNSTIGLNTAILSPYLTNIKEEKRPTKSPTLKDNIKKVEDLIENLSAKVSIYNTESLPLEAAGTSTTSKQFVSNVELNGLESSERVDPHNFKDDDVPEIVKEATNNDQYKHTAQK